MEQNYVSNDSPLMQSNISIDFSAKSNLKTNPRGPRGPKTPKAPLTLDEIEVIKSNQPKLDPTQSSVFINTGDKKAHHSNVKQNEDNVKVINLGGLEEVGANMAVVEYKDDMIIVDAGIVFPGGELYGIDYLIPDISYIRKNIRKVKGILITHGHLDHIGALKHVLPELNWPIVYGSPLAIGMIKKALEEAKLLKFFKYKIINPDTDLIKLGCFTIEFFRVNHNIPETMGCAIHTPKGLVVFTGDFKIDFTPAIDKPADIAKIARLGQEGVKVLLCESTNAVKPGRTTSEKVIGDNLDRLIKDSTGRIVVATFASNVGRVIQLIQSAVKYNRVVFLAGRSMINYTEIAKELGYINVPPQMLRKMPADVEGLPDNRVMIICTGAQGEEFSALQRISKGEYPHFKIRNGDRILASASPIPGNEKQFFNMLNDLISQGVDIVTNSDLDIHASGHGYAEDIKMMISLFKPEYLIPIHGEVRLRDATRRHGIEVGVAPENVLFASNGSIVELYDEGAGINERKIKLDTVMIDGYGIGHMSGEFVLKARQIMSQNGMVNLILKIDSKTKNLVGNIQIESRGFVYSSEVKTVHTDIVRFVDKRYTDLRNRIDDVKEILRIIKGDLEQHLAKALDRVPMIIPSFVYINDSARGTEEDGTPTTVVATTLDVPQEGTQEELIVGTTLEAEGGEEHDHTKPHDPVIE